MLTLKIILAKLIIFAIKVIGLVTKKEQGSNLTGKIMLKLDKNLVRKFKGLNYNNVFFVTGTNGKSSTVNILVHVLKESGFKVVSNLEGANLLSGICTSLLKSCSINGNVNADYFVFETDERYLNSIVNNIPGKNLAVTNIQKDQVQRNGDPDYIYQKIKNSIREDMTLYLNNDEPRTKSLESCSENVFYYGLNRHEKSFEKNGFMDVTMACPKCSDKLVFDYYNIDNVGKYSCSACGFAPSPDGARIESVDLNNNSFDMLGDTFHLPYSEPFMLYNYSLSVTLLKNLGITSENISKALKSFIKPKGRTATLEYKDKKIHYIKIKQENPETLQSSFDVVSFDKEKKVLLIGLMVVGDIVPNYTNIFYAFDCNVKPLIASNVEKIICFGEPVAYDVANRFIYAGAEEKIKVLCSDDPKEIFREIDNYDSSQVYLITWTKSFFEMQEYLKNQK